MEVKEAIEYLKKAQVCMARSTGMSANRPLYKAFMLAIFALKKQIPMLVDTRKTQWGERDFCPICGCVIENCHSRFCIWCGQALDWSDK